MVAGARRQRAVGGFGVGVIDDLDEISDTVCAVVDVAEVCRNTHPDPRWVAARRGRTCAWGTCRDSTPTPALQAPWRAERLVIAHQRLRGWRSPFVTISSEAAYTSRRETSSVGKASGRVIRLGMEFQQIYRILLDWVRRRAANELGRLPASLLSRMMQQPQPGGGGGGSSMSADPPGPGHGLARVLLDSQTLGAAMRWVECEDTRRAIYTAAHAGPAANRAALDGLLDARAEVAGLLGFQSHAHYVTAPLLAGHPDAVRRLLGDMSARAMDRAGRRWS